ncbi:MAG TPA: preprotein translocase subunit SecE [Bryobacteraceae bacterium]|nr:preprotein translocase subunit SecE [Bryobacteraceae bacterium]
MAIAQAEDNTRNMGDRALAWPGRLKNYIEELQTEMKRVTWPNWKQVRATTIVVILSVFAFAAYFFAVDWVCQKTVVKLFNVLTR